MHSYYVPSPSKIQQLQQLQTVLTKRFKASIVDSSLNQNELSFTVDSNVLLEFCVFLKDDHKCLFKQLIDITAVDYPSREQRFEVVYIFLSLIHNMRIRIKINTNENVLIPSLTSLYSNADWLEREVWDMFGIYFKDHKDLRRLLTDFGFDGHPLRKDFPLTGFVEASYDEIAEKVVYKPVQLMQAFRNFEYSSPWMQGIEVEAFTNNQNPSNKIVEEGQE